MLKFKSKDKSKEVEVLEQKSSINIAPISNEGSLDDTPSVPTSVAMQAQAQVQTPPVAMQNMNQSSIPLPGVVQGQNQVAVQTPVQNGEVNVNSNTNNSQVPSARESLGLPQDNNQQTKVARPVYCFRYTVINSVGKKENGTFDAESENDVRNFLLSLGYQVLEVKPRNKLDVDIGTTKFSAHELSFSLTQLATYLRAGIALADSVKILAKQSTKPGIKKNFNQVVYQLLRGESLSEAMDSLGPVFPKLLINMVKTAELTGDLPSILDDMSEYYTSMDQTRKQMKSAMTYPIIVLIIAFGVLFFMLTYLVPQFVSLFEENGAELPAITRFIINVSNFFSHNWYWVLLIMFVIIIAFYEAYKRLPPFKMRVQYVLMHTPVIKDIIIYNEIANFTKTFASLLNHGVFITDSMEILSKISNNEIYKKIINNTLENLGKGDSISTAFKGQWAIPVVAYEMILTGESTGQLGAMMEKVANYFQMLHKTKIDQMKSLVEPLLICLLAVIVGVILLSIIQPMFSIYGQIK